VKLDIQLPNSGPCLALAQDITFRHLVFYQGGKIHHIESISETELQHEETDLVSPGPFGTPELPTPEDKLFLKVSPSGGWVLYCLRGTTFRCFMNGPFSSFGVKESCVGAEEVVGIAPSNGSIFQTKRGLGYDALLPKKTARKYVYLAGNRLTCNDSIELLDPARLQQLFPEGGTGFVSRVWGPKGKCWAWVQVGGPGTPILGSEITIDHNGVEGTVESIQSLFTSHLPQDCKEALISAHPYLPIHMSRTVQWAWANAPGPHGDIIGAAHGPKDKGFYWTRLGWSFCEEHGYGLCREDAWGTKIHITPDRVMVPR